MILQNYNIIYYNNIVYWLVTGPKTVILRYIDKNKLTEKGGHLEVDLTQRFSPGAIVRLRI